MKTLEVFEGVLLFGGSAVLWYIGEISNYPAMFFFLSGSAFIQAITFLQKGFKKNENKTR